MTRNAAALAFCLICLLWTASPTRAQGMDMANGGPIDVTAAGGIEYRDAEKLAIATGDARAVRGGTTVLADQLIARLRKKAPGSPVPAKAGAASGSAEESGNEVYRLEAHGHVRILTATDEAVGDDAVYDIDQAVLVLTGKALKVTSPQQVMTARDTIEYWSDRHMSVGRGNAVVVTSDRRRLAADVLVAFTADDQPAVQQASTAAPRPPAKPAAGDDPLASRRLQRVEAYGNVEVRTPVDIARGDRGLYLADTDIARLIGHVRITHEGNQINGPAADVNMKTGIARIVSDPAQRVQGQLLPNAGKTGSVPAGRTP